MEKIQDIFNYNPNNNDWLLINLIDSKNNILHFHWLLKMKTKPYKIKDNCVSFVFNKSYVCFRTYFLSKNGKKSPFYTIYLSTNDDECQIDLQHFLTSFYVINNEEAQPFIDKVLKMKNNGNNSIKKE